MQNSWAGNLRSGEAFFTAFVAFLACGFLLRPNPVWAFVYYAAVLPTFAALLWHRRAEISLRDPSLGIALAAIGWFGLTLSWGIDQPPAKIPRYLISVFVNASFVLAAYLFFLWGAPFWRMATQRVISVSAAANSLISMILFAFEHPGVFGLGEYTGVRLEGWAETRHPILGANVMCIALVLALSGLLSEPQRGWRVAHGATAALCVLFVFATGSRGPFLAMLAAASGFLILSRRFAVLAILGGAAVLGALAVVLVPGGMEFVVGNLERNSFRLDIWREAVGLAAQRPWLGYGAANAHWFVLPKITFPHSLYVSALYYGGVVGLGLVLAMLVSVATRAWRSGGEDRALFLALLTVPVVGGLTDIGQFVKSPSELWYILWLPVAAILGTTRRGGMATQQGEGS